MQTLKINAAEENKGERLDKFIADNSDISRSYAAKLCEDGLVLCGEKQLLKKYKILGTEEITINVPEPEELSIEPENIPLNIVYEDSDVIVVNKPQGLCVHPAPGNESGTLVNGNIKEDSGTINKPIGRNPSDRKKMAVVFGGREAVTHFNVLERFGQYTLVECILETGRTHQIRVHMASIGHSIVGDPLYGIKKEKFNLNGQLLHAKTIGFVHPRTGKMMEFTSDIPEYFENVLEKLRKR